VGDARNRDDLRSGVRGLDPHTPASIVDIGLGVGTGGQPGIFMAETITSGITQVRLGSQNAFAVNTFYKGAYAYAADNFAFSEGGNSPGTDLSGALPTSITVMQIGFRENFAFLNGHIKRLAYYAERKSNAKLQVLST